MESVQSSTPQSITVVMRRAVVDQGANARVRDARYDVQFTLNKRTPRLAQGNVITVPDGHYEGSYLLGHSRTDTFGWQVATGRILPTVD